MVNYGKSSKNLRHFFELNNNINNFNNFLILLRTTFGGSICLIVKKELLRLF